jgi:malate dehydrogenase (oxaloacetate-decarboxylating)(NADP+)
MPPVMEGKAVLFKKFAGIDVFDVELAENDVDKLVDVVAARHDDRGAVLVVVEDRDLHPGPAALLDLEALGRLDVLQVNGLELAGKPLSEVKIVTSGAGAAALACLNQLVSLGARAEEDVGTGDDLGERPRLGRLGIDRLPAVHQAGAA